MSLQDVADKVGVNKTTIKRWEDGSIGSMGIDKVELLAAALSVTPAFIMGWEDEYGKLIPQDDVLAIRQEAHDNPDLRVLFDLGRECDATQLKQAIAIIRALKGEYDD